jgi:cobalt-precorrin 5A hydrolase
LGQGEVLLADGEVRRTLETMFLAGRPMVCIMALGIVVRIVGPLVHDKDTDPPVVVVDEAGRFAISVLGGHGGGANVLAERVARALGAIAVITTASDALKMPAVDLIGRDWGWVIERRDDLTQLAAAVVRGEPVGVWQEAGRRDWCEPFGAWPATFQRIENWPPREQWAGLIVISDRALTMAESAPVVIYRPPSLILGVGCRRGVPCEEIEATFQRVCETRRLSPSSLGMVATASLKAEEPGLREFTRQHRVPLRSFSLEELAAVGPLPTPSQAVRAKIGISGVAEPAAMLAAETRSLLMPKYRGARVTMALARKENV